MTPFLLGLLAGSWLTTSALAYLCLAADGEVRGLWRLWLAVAAPALVAWTVAGWVWEAVRRG